MGVEDESKGREKRCKGDTKEKRGRQATGWRYEKSESELGKQRGRERSLEM